MTQPMFKKAFYVALPVLAAAAPIAAFSTSEWWPAITVSLSPEGELGDTTETVPNESTLGSADSVAERPVPRSLQSAPVHDLGEVFRFDVTPDWIVYNWPRVSSGLAHLPLQGYRVPLVSGTSQDDVAGSLTYYFNAQQRLQRITLHGTTGSTLKLAHLMKVRFGFVRRLTNDPGVFLYEVPDSKGQVNGFLWFRTA
ncbi:MAG: DUF6690 family protein, partial [Planctomycetota bacterium]